MDLTSLIIAVAAGFIAGLLVGRRNRKKLEAAIWLAKQAASKVQSKIG